jgi:hypothetical protein
MVEGGHLSLVGFEVHDYTQDVAIDSCLYQRGGSNKYKAMKRG